MPHRRLDHAATLALAAALVAPTLSTPAQATRAPATTTPTPVPVAPGFTATKAPCPGTLVPASPPPPSPGHSRTGTAPARSTPTPTPTTPNPRGPRYPAPTITAGAHPVGGDLLGSNGLVTSLPAGVPAPPDLDATSYVLADQDTGAIIAAKAPHARLYPASTLKTLTALTLLDGLAASRVITAAPADQAAEGTRVGLVAGNPYRVDQLWGALLLLSANDAAYALARSSTGGVTGSVARMNSLARQLGAHDTTVVDPSGLDQPTQRSSAYDLALIGRAAMARKDFRAYAQQRSIMFPGATTPDGTVVAPYPVQSHNHFLLGYPGATGVKNGYTTGAHRTYISSASRGGRSYLLTFMCSDTVSTPQMAAMYDWAFAHGSQAHPVGTLVTPAPSSTSTPGPSGSGASTPWPRATAPELHRSDSVRDLGPWWGAGALTAVVIGAGLALTRRWSRR